MNNVCGAPVRKPVLRLVGIFLFSTVFVYASSLPLRAGEPVSAQNSAPSLTPSNPLASINHLPANNPYKAPLARWLTLPATDRSALIAWTDAEKITTSETDKSPATITAKQVLHYFDTDQASAADNDDLRVLGAVIR